MSAEELATKTFKIRLVTLFTIIGGTISACLVVSSYLSSNEKKLDSVVNTANSVKESVTEMKGDIKEIKKNQESLKDKDNDLQRQVDLKQDSE